MPDYRRLARASLNRANSELASSDPARWRYAALELRDAMEAVTYDRALAFRDEIPPEEYRTWQPRKLMAALVDIDASIGLTSTISLGLEEEYGKAVAPENMNVLGTDHVFTIGDLKSHYDAIGSYLHMPSLEQAQSGNMPDLEKLKKRCEQIVPVIASVLGSSVWNCTIGNFATLAQCMNEDCGKPVRKRMPFGKDAIDARCFNCKAEYTITNESEGRVLWSPKMTEVPCSTAGCSKKMPLWPKELTAGTHWRCSDCGAHNRIVLSVSKLPD